MFSSKVKLFRKVEVNEIFQFSPKASTIFLEIFCILKTMLFLLKDGGIR